MKSQVNGRLPKYEDLEQFLYTFSDSQNAVFRYMNTKCSQVQQLVSSLEKTIQQLQQKLKKQWTTQQSYKLLELREKQKQFIIQELETKVRKLNQNEQYFESLILQKETIIEKMSISIEEKQKQIYSLREDGKKANNSIKNLTKMNIKLKSEQRASILNQVEQLPYFNTSNSKQNQKEQVSLKTIMMSKQKEREQRENYQQIEQKLKEMEDCLNNQIEEYKKRNYILQQQVQKMKNENKLFSQNNKSLYQFQIKSRNLEIQNAQLQRQNLQLQNTSNENEIKFHKKLNQLKMQVFQLKKGQKGMIKKIQESLNSLAVNLLAESYKQTIFIGIPSLPDQFKQLEKQILKLWTKRSNKISAQKEAIIEDLTQNLLKSKQKINQLTVKYERVRNKVEERPALNGGSKNTSKVEVQSREKEKEKDKIIQRLENACSRNQQKIQQLKTTIQQKEKLITALRKKFDESETLQSQKIISLERALADKQMELKYIQKKKLDETKIAQQLDSQIKEVYAQQVLKLKEKIKQLDSSKEQSKWKIKEQEEKLISQEKKIRQGERKQKQLRDKIKKLQAKVGESQKIAQAKNKSIQQLIGKNQILQAEAKYLKEKAKIIEMSINSVKENATSEQSAPTISLKEVSAQLAFKTELFQKQMEQKQETINELKEEIEMRSQTLKKKDEKIDELMKDLRRIDNQNKMLRSECQIMKQSMEKLKCSGEKVNDFSALKQQYEKREKMLMQEGEKIIGQIKQNNKDIFNQNKKLTEQISAIKEENQKLKAQKLKNSETKNENIKVKQLQANINTLKSKIRQLQKSNQKKAAPKLFKGTDSVQYISFAINTDSILKNDQAINTIDIFAIQTQQNTAMNRILDLNYEEQIQNQDALKNSNLFMNLKDNANMNDDDVFEICDENEEVNFGQGSANLQVRELFTSLRIEIQKLFNQEEISFGISKLLPQALQDDYYELMSYIKEKIGELRVHNQISFIMAEVGNQPYMLEQSDFQIPELLKKGQSQPTEQLKKVLQQKQALINSLMNEKTEQQNTINQLTMQKQQIQEQNENRFMNQCNVYKKEIKQHKKTIDVLQMNFQSMKNIIRNILEAYTVQDDMQDDFRDSLTLYAKLCQLAEKDRSRMNLYIQKYLEIKGFV